MKIKNIILLSLVVVCGSSMLTGCWTPPERGKTTGSEKWENVSSDTRPAGNTNEKKPESNMNKNVETAAKKEGFEANLPEGFAVPTDDVGKRMLKEYGSLFIARGGATPPKTAIFKDESEVTSFQSSLTTSRETIGGITIELQSAAMNALKTAIADAKGAGRTITPRGADAARRTYSGTVDLWKSRVEPGLTHWVGKGRVTKEEAQKIRGLSPFEQVPEIFRLESQGIYFAKDLSKSIIYSVAPPGTSQHLSMLALDVNEHDDARVREILAKNGWFQTVVSDLPHFTYLGVGEDELSGLGLKKVSDGGRTYWLPSI
jgi:hypothetical protein